MPSSGVSACVIGESWLGVEYTARPVPSGAALRDRRALVGRRVPREPGPVVDEPRPARAEALDPGVVHRRLQFVEPAERRADRVTERPARLSAAAGPHDLPEEAVVRVA